MKRKKNSRYFVRYLDEVIRIRSLLVLILLEMSCCVKTFKDKDGDNDKNNNDKLMPFCIEHW